MTKKKELYFGILGYIIPVFLIGALAIFLVRPTRVNEKQSAERIGNFSPLERQVFIQCRIVGNDKNFCFKVVDDFNNNVDYTTSNP